MLQKIVCLAVPGTAPFEFGVICEVFGIDRSDSCGPQFEFTIATAEPGPVRTSLGYDMVIDQDLSVAAEADLLAIPAHHTRGMGDEQTDERVLQAIRDAEVVIPEGATSQTDLLPGFELPLGRLLALADEWRK